MARFLERIMERRKKLPKTSFCLTAKTPMFIAQTTNLNCGDEYGHTVNKDYMIKCNRKMETKTTYRYKKIFGCTKSDFLCRNFKISKIRMIVNVNLVDPLRIIVALGMRVP